MLPLLMVDLNEIGVVLIKAFYVPDASGLA
jgi:hypothetical protein